MSQLFIPSFKKTFPEALTRLIQWFSNVLVPRPLYSLKKSLMISKSFCICGSNLAIFTVLEIETKTTQAHKNETRGYLGHTLRTTLLIAHLPFALPFGW